MIDSTTDLTYHVRELHQEINVWHQMIYTPAVKAFNADTNGTCKDDVNQALILSLEPYKERLKRMLTHRRPNQAAIVVLSNWNKDKLAQSYIEQVVANQLYAGGH